MTTEELNQTYFSRNLPRFLPRLAIFLFFFKFLEPLVPRTSLNDCFFGFLPFCTVFRKIVPEKLHRCPHVLEYPHRLLSFSNILPIEFYGMKSDGILIVLKQPVRNIENTRKYALK